MSKMASKSRVEETIQQIIPGGGERKMDIEQIIDSMTPEVYQRLATAVELGKMAGWRRADAGAEGK